MDLLTKLFKMAEWPFDIGFLEVLGGFVNKVIQNGRIGHLT